jgi:hypothetical protein
MFTANQADVGSSTPTFYIATGPAQHSQHKHLRACEIGLWYCCNTGHKWYAVFYQRAPAVLFAVQGVGSAALAIYLIGESVSLCTSG